MSHSIKGWQTCEKIVVLCYSICKTTTHLATKWTRCKKII